MLDQIIDLQTRFMIAKPMILDDKTLWKHLRFCQALRKAKKEPTRKQWKLVSQSMTPHLEAVGITIEMLQSEVAQKLFQDFASHLGAVAWQQGDAILNMKAIKKAKNFNG